MRLRSIFLLAAISFAPAAARAAANCPWYSQGSAEKALGGAVTAAIQVSDSGEGSCTFTRQQGTKDTLKVVVAKAPVESCPANSEKVVGVGNEADLCTVQRSPKEMTHLLVSRVREFHFTVSIAAEPGSSLAADPAAIDAAVKRAAEQVAGNLF